MRRRGGLESAEEGRLRSRPGQPPRLLSSGLHRLGIDARRDALLSIPRNIPPDEPRPFVLALHGAGGREESGLFPLRTLAEERGFYLLAPASRGRTWDLLVQGYGPDVAFIDRALAEAFACCNVDPARVAVSGFSDGASYALSLGITNGDLFGNVLAFSPGFSAPAVHRGQPRLFISHGVHDPVLRIDVTSRRIVPQLERAGFAPRYEEFDGAHTVTPEIAREAIDWFLEDRRA